MHWRGKMLLLTLLRAIVVFSSIYSFSKLVLKYSSKPIVIIP